ncbi:MAG: hypothetical protein CVV23_07235 [Ignavibacteriae bacterium HGW-Ignavibacteriae-2]|nr:MAG: hypothetical protein CVV23_07235 [Ignavibacteriae bacterium HGW-Ignavibacteriae-2]
MIKGLFMKKNSVLILLLLILSSLNINSQVIDSVLNKIITKSIDVSPKLRALRYKQNISESKIAQVSNLSDPMLTFGLMSLPINSFEFDEEPMSGKILGISQSVPFPGKLSAAVDVQSKDVGINQQEIDDATNEIVNDISKMYYDLRFIRESIRIAEENKTILEKIAEVVRIKYSVSKASQQNLIQIELELTRIKDKLADLRGKEKSNVAGLNNYMLRNIDENISTSVVPEIPEENITFNTLNETSKLNRPFLKGLRLAEEKSKLMEHLAEYDFYPNFNFSIQYTQRDQLKNSNMPANDFLSFMVGINLPIDYGGKKSAKVEESRLMQKMYADQYESALQMLNKNFGVAINNLQSLKEREKLITEGLLPQAEQSLNISLTSYQVGDIDFINVLDAQNKLYEIETTLYNIRTMYFKELSQLEFLTGERKNNY